MNIARRTSRFESLKVGFSRREDRSPDGFTCSNEKDGPSHSLEERAPPRGIPTKWRSPT